LARLVLRHNLGDSDSKSAVAFTESDGQCQRAALVHEPSYWVQGVLIDGFDSTTKSLRTLFLYCLRHALHPLPDQLVGLSTPVRKGLRTQFHTLLHRCHQRKRLRVVALGQRLRRVADHVTATVGEAHGERVRHGFEEKKSGWYAGRKDPKMPVMRMVLDQAHHAMDRQLFSMQGFHHPGGSQAAFLTGLAHLYNLIPYQGEPRTRGCVV